MMSDEPGPVPSPEQQREPQVSYSLAAVEPMIPFSSYDWTVRITLPCGTPIKSTGRSSTFEGGARQIRKRVRRTLGWWRYMRIRRTMP